MTKPANTMKCFLSGMPCTCGTCNSAGAARVAAKKSHPWRTWTPDKVSEKYVPKVKIPYQDRMGLK